MEIGKGRREDTTPVVCERCGWKGTVKDSVHTYHDDGTGEDVEPTDECPNCGSDNLTETELVTTGQLWNHRCNQCDGIQWFPDEYKGEKKCDCSGTYIPIKKS